METYSEFKEFIVNNIKGFLPEEYRTAEVVIHPILKNNDTKLDALLIKKENVNIFPSIYLNGFYKDYLKGETLEQVIGKIVELNEEYSLQDNFDIFQITEYDQVKEKIFPRLVNAEKNTERLSALPFMKKLDLAVIYTIELTKPDDNIACITVTNNILQGWGITADELHALAIANLEEKSEPIFTDMRTALGEMLISEMMTKDMMSKDEAVEHVDTLLPWNLLPMYIITNASKTNGANVLLNEKFMGRVADQLGGNFFVLPSSVHECICIPEEDAVGDNMDYHELEEIVKEVNVSQVSPEERLSDCVYKYDIEIHELVQCNNSAAMQDYCIENSGQVMADQVLKHQRR